MGVQLSRELALRIGMAARALPGVTAGPLLNGLVGQLGWPLNEDKLARLTVTQLRNALSQGGSIDADIDMPTADVADRFSVPLLKEVVEILWGNKVEDDDDLPPIEPYEDGDLPGSIRAAVASDSGEELNAHFGSARRYLIYQLTPEECRLIDVRPADGADEAEDSSAFRAAVDRRLSRALRAVDRRPGGGEGHQHGGLPAQVHRRGPGPAPPRRALQEDGLGASALAGEGHERPA